MINSCGLGLGTEPRLDAALHLSQIKASFVAMWLQSVSPCGVMTPAESCRFVMTPAESPCVLTPAVSPCVPTPACVSCLLTPAVSPCVLTPVCVSMCTDSSCVSMCTDSSLCRHVSWLQSVSPWVLTPVCVCHVSWLQSVSPCVYWLQSVSPCVYWLQSVSAMCLWLQSVSPCVLTPVCVAMCTDSSCVAMCPDSGCVAMCPDSGCVAMCPDSSLCRHVYWLQSVSMCLIQSVSTDSPCADSSRHVSWLQSVSPCVWLLSVLSTDFCLCLLTPVCVAMCTLHVSPFVLQTPVRCHSMPLSLLSVLTPAVAICPDSKSPWLKSVSCNLSWLPDFCHVARLPLLHLLFGLHVALVDGGYWSFYRSCLHGSWVSQVFCFESAIKVLFPSLQLWQYFPFLSLITIYPMTCFSLCHALATS